MANPVRILHLDDNPLDAQLVSLALESEEKNLPTIITYVQTEEAYLAALDSEDFDIILSDYRMPSFDGDEALAVAIEKCPETPFIMVTGELGEERVIETLQRGATDYVLKDRIFRLVPAIRRALDIAALKRSHKLAQQTLRENEERFRLALDTEYFILAQTDLEARYTWIYHPDLDTAQALGKLDSELDLSEESRELEAIKLRVLKTGTSFKGELGIRRMDGIHYYEVIIELRRDAGGKTVGLTTAALDITERTLAEEALRESRETLTLAVKATNLGLFDYYPRIGLLLWNNEAKAHFGLPPEAPVTYELFLRAVHPDDRGRVHTTLQNVLKPGNIGISKLEYRTVGLRDGLERWIDSRGQVFFDEKRNAVRFIGTTNDITVRKQIEEALHAHEETIDAFFEASPAILNIFDDELRFIQTDRLTPTYYGLDRQSIVGRSLRDLNPEFAEQYVEPLMKRVLELNEPEVNIEVTGLIPSRKGSPASWQMAFFRVRLPGNRPGLGAIGYETTELKAAQEKLRQVQEQYRLLVEQQTDLVVRISREGIYLYVNKNFLDMLGKKEHDVINTSHNPEIHPDDRERVAAKWRETFEPPDYRSAFEVRTMTSDGWRWVSWRNTAVFDDQGVSSSAICVGRDVTERKTAEDDLRGRESRFRSLISSSSDPIAMVDENGILLAISNSAASILGSTPPELVNRNVHQLVPPEHIDAIASSLLQLRTHPDVPQYVLVRLQTNKGPNLWVELEATAIVSGEQIHAYFFRLRPVLLGE